jgi:hypothetical protein
MMSLVASFVQKLLSMRLLRFIPCLIFVTLLVPARAPAQELGLVRASGAMIRLSNALMDAETTAKLAEVNVQRVIHGTLGSSLFRPGAIGGGDKLTPVELGRMQRTLWYLHQIPSSEHKVSTALLSTFPQIATIAVARELGVVQGWNADSRIIVQRLEKYLARHKTEVAKTLEEMGILGPVGELGRELIQDSEGSAFTIGDQIILHLLTSEGPINRRNLTLSEINHLPHSVQQHFGDGGTLRDIPASLVGGEIWRGRMAQGLSLSTRQALIVLFPLEREMPIFDALAGLDPVNAVTRFSYRGDSEKALAVLDVFVGHLRRLVAPFADLTRDGLVIKPGVRIDTDRFRGIFGEVLEAARRIDLKGLVKRNFQTNLFHNDSDPWIRKAGQIQAKQVEMFLDDLVSFDRSLRPKD